MLASIARLAVPAWEFSTRPSTRVSRIAYSQERILARILHALRATAVGERFGLQRFAGAPDASTAFRAEMPMTEYADYASLIERAASGERNVLFRGRALALAQTSGTTRDAQAGERYVPQGRALLHHHRKGGAAALARLARMAGGELFSGRMLMLSGSTALEPHGAVPAGDLSGICAGRLPRWIRSCYEPGSDIAAIADVDARIAATVERCQHTDLRVIAGIPSWILVLLRALCDRRGVARASDVWPAVRGVVHGGHAIDPFIRPLIEHLGEDTWMMEVYPASEAFIAIGERPWRLGEGGPPALELLTSHGVFLEFIPDGGQVDHCVGAHEVEAGQIYRVLVTTPGGLLRYQVGDLVTGVAPGRIRFAGRVKARLSAFGEHVEGFALAEALAHACSSTDATVVNYHVAPIFPAAGHAAGRHEWLVEFDRPPEVLHAFARSLDTHLREHVIDYAAHRAADRQLLAPLVRPLPPGTFRAFLAGHGRCDLQRKIPQAWPDRTIADRLQTLADALSTPPARRTPA